MPIINNSYFNGGERGIPNVTAPEVSSLVTYLVAVHEKEFLIKLLGYELYELFIAGIQLSTPEARFTDMLFGKTFTGSDGRKKRWNGFATVTSAVPSISITTNPGSDLYFTVGDTGAPADGSDTYTNATLANKTYRVIQRGTGPLEPLKTDNSNSTKADIEILTGGGFKHRNGIKFSQGDKYTIVLETSSISTSGVTVSPVLESPIADYVYFKYLIYKNEQVTGVGTVKAEAQNSTAVTPKHKVCNAYNAMVEKCLILHDMFVVYNTVYPEFSQHAYSEELELLLEKMNPWF